MAINSQFHTLSELENLIKYSEKDEQKQLVSQMKNEMISLSSNIHRHSKEAQTEY